MQEDFRNFWGECPWDEDLQYAQGVCDQVRARPLPPPDLCLDACSRTFNPEVSLSPV